MKAQDLMIGDWVSYRRDYPDRINGISVDAYSVHLEKDGWIPIMKINPIPLTSEILEKNGFRYDGSGQMSMMLIAPYGISGTRWNIYIGLKHKTIDIFSAPPVEKYPGWRKHNKVYLEVCGCFVHELQHALRLCGIEKEIKL